VWVTQHRHELGAVAGIAALALGLLTSRRRMA
jgi:hypothetical protein